MGGSPDLLVLESDEGNGRRVCILTEPLLRRDGCYLVGEERGAGTGEVVLSAMFGTMFHAGMAGLPARQVELWGDVPCQVPNCGVIMGGNGQDGQEQSAVADIPQDNIRALVFWCRLLGVLGRNGDRQFWGDEREADQDAVDTVTGLLAVGVTAMLEEIFGENDAVIAEPGFFPATKHLKLLTELVNKPKTTVAGYPAVPNGADKDRVIDPGKFSAEEVFQEVFGRDFDRFLREVVVNGKGVFDALFDWSIFSKCNWSEKDFMEYVCALTTENEVSRTDDMVFFVMNNASRDMAAQMAKKAALCRLAVAVDGEQQVSGEQRLLEFIRKQPLQDLARELELKCRQGLLKPVLARALWLLSLADKAAYETVYFWGGVSEVETDEEMYRALRSFPPLGQRIDPEEMRLSVEGLVNKGEAVEVYGPVKLRPDLLRISLPEDRLDDEEAKQYLIQLKGRMARETNSGRINLYTSPELFAMIARGVEEYGLQVAIVDYKTTTDGKSSLPRQRDLRQILPYMMAWARAVAVYRWYTTGKVLEADSLLDDPLVENFTAQLAYFIYAIDGDAASYKIAIVNLMEDARLKEKVRGMYRDLFRHATTIMRLALHRREGNVTQGSF